jgi:hypothetical protein
MNLQHAYYWLACYKLVNSDYLFELAIYLCLLWPLASPSCPVLRLNSKWQWFCLQMALSRSQRIAQDAEDYIMQDIDREGLEKKYINESIGK